MMNHAPRMALYFFSAMTCSPATARSSSILARIALSPWLTLLAAKSLGDLAQHVVVARFLEIGGDDFLGIGISRGTRDAHFAGRPQAQKLVPARVDLEARFLVMGEFRLGAFFACLETV
jgi:hypothetical protein